jgi:hypothetical protein
VRKIKELLSTVAIAALLFSSMSAQVISPFNKREVKDTSEKYSFIVSGHFHGSSTTRSFFPASSLLASIDTLNKLAPAFLMSLGDMFIDVDENYINLYRKSFFNKISFPLFNSVGNHDLANGNKYGAEFGKTFSFFRLASELYIILDTELDDGSIKGEQLEMLKAAFKRADDSAVKNIFIFSHRPVWAEEIPKYQPLFKGNTRSAGKNNFIPEILPLLKTLSFKKQIIWMSGSTGGGPASFFYDRDPETNMIFMQSAIRDVHTDAVLRVKMDKGKCTFQGISLTDEKLDPVENYNIDYWRSVSPQEEKFNYRLLPMIILNGLKHIYFWIGFLSSLLFGLILVSIYKRWKKRR